MSELSKAIAASCARDAVQGEDGWFSQTFVFPLEFQGFLGHFPGRPILPAMVQMMAAAHVASCWLGAMPDVRGVKQARFLTPVAPGMPMTVHARPQGPNAAEVRVMAGGHPVATFTLIF